MSRQTIAVSVKASKLTARALAYVVAAVGRKIAKEHRKAQTPHGKQSVRKLMGHGGDTNAIDMGRDLLRRSHVLVVCGHTVTEAMKNDIAVAQRLGITATTLEGILTVKGQGRR